jgi:hypothetical protein
MSQIGYVAGFWTCVILGIITLFGPKDLMYLSSHWTWRIIATAMLWLFAYLLNKKILAGKSSQE